MITLPPAHFFGGIDHARALDSAIALRDLGAEVFEFDTSPGYQQDERAVENQLGMLRTFRPDLAIAASQSGYAIEATVTHDEADLSRIFLDALDVPLICYWDQIIPQLARYLMPSRPTEPTQSERGLIRRMRDLMRHPNAFHFIPDTGHIARLQALGIVDALDSAWMVTSIPAIYVRHGRQNALPRGKTPLAFFGNLYLAAANAIDYGGNEELLKVRGTALSKAAADWKLAPYDAYVAAIAALTEDQRTRLSLDPDETFHWQFLFDELSVVANGALRLGKLNASGRAVHSFGGFADPPSNALVREAGWIANDGVAYGISLAARYASAGISIDVANAPFISGFSPKLFECFASGGFMLTTRQADLKAAIGDLADVICFSSVDELSAKIDRFAGNDRERREVGDAIREIVRSEYTASALFQRTIPQALAAIRARR